MFKSVCALALALMLAGLTSPLITSGGQVSTEENGNVFSFKLLLSEKRCQLAIWLTDEKGAFVDTVYVTRYLAKKGLGPRKGGLDDR